MKNFLIIVLALGLAGSAFLTRPDRAEFERYVRDRNASSPDNPVEIVLKHVAGKGDDVLGDDLEFKDFYLWTVVQKDGRTLYTGVFDRWIDNEQMKHVIPS